MSVEDRSRRTLTVRPQRDEHYECQFECDSAVSAQSDRHDIGLKGETDDEDMEDGETGFDDGRAQVRCVRDWGQPTDHIDHAECDETLCELATHWIGCL